MPEKENVIKDFKDRWKKTEDESPGFLGSLLDAMDGEGARKLIGAAYKAQELGMDNESIIFLLEEISNYWDEPFPTSRMEAMKRQIAGW